MSNPSATDSFGAARHGKPLRILILGGTAFIGIHMTELALQRGHTVTFFNRGRTTPERFADVERLRGDRNGQLEALRGRQWDAVIDNSGYVPRHVRMSAELLAGNVGQYLFVSTISVYADFTKANNEGSPVGRVADESREDWTNAYGPLKALCERAAESAMPGRTTAIRPGLIVGPEDPTDRFTYWPARATRSGEMLAPGRPQASFQLIDARDLARFCIAAIERSLVGVFNVTSPPGRFTMSNVVGAAAAAAKALVKPTPASQPTWVSSEFLQESALRPFVDLPGWLREDGDMGRLHHTQVQRAIAAGLTISPLEVTARDTLAWHLARPEAERARLRAGITAERERELLARWHAAHGEH